MDLVETSASLPVHRHPWETARAAFFLRVLRDAGLLRPGLSAVDVGSGDGWLASRVAVAAKIPTVTCWDTGYERVSPAPHPALRYVSQPPPGERYALALLLDVLEHVEDDAGFLGAIVAGMLEPDAALLLSVPAWPALFSEHDRRLLHHRRYTPARARALIEGSGLRVERSGGLFHGLLLARGAQWLRERLLTPTRPPPHAGEWHHGAAVTGLVSAALNADAAISRAASRLRLQLPGLSWWALCRRPS